MREWDLYDISSLVFAEISFVFFHIVHLYILKRYTSVFDEYGSLSILLFKSSLPYSFI